MMRIGYRIDTHPKLGVTIQRDVESMEWCPMRKRLLQYLGIYYLVIPVA